MAIYSLESVTGKDHIQTVYCRKDNPIQVILKLDDKEYDYTAAKEIRVKIGQTEFDSQSDPDAFDRTESELGRLSIFIGDQTTILPQAYNLKLELVDATDKVLYFGQIRVRIDDSGM